MARQFGVDTANGAIRCVQFERLSVHRVGYRPDPWMWTPWKYAGADGTFEGPCAGGEIGRGTALDWNVRRNFDFA